MTKGKKHLTPDNVGTKISDRVTSLLGIGSKRNGYKIHVQTRDCKSASTDSSVYCAIIGKNGERTSDLLLDNILHDDMERGNEDVFIFSHVEHIDEIASIHLWRDTTNENDKWFCEYILVTHTHCDRDEACSAKGATLPFPSHQWIKPSHKYELFVYDFCLPQLDTVPTRKLQRKEEVIDKKISYKYESEITGFPRRIANLPNPEMFSSDYQWDITSRKLQLLAEKKVQEWFGCGSWNTFDDMLTVYKRTFSLPKGWYNWKSDHKFGDQRLNGLNTTQLQRCEQIPSKFPVTDEMVKPFLDGHTLSEVIQQKRLFIVDLEILDGVPTKDGVLLPAPLALFYANTKGELLPLAIQLFPQPAEDNPIFLPSDPEYTWMLAKMYFNSADASIHQSCNHLGFTHLVIESICCAAYQSLPTCHPVFQLLAPHFIYLLAINSLGLNKLLEAGGWFDTAMTIGAVGFDEILRRRWKNWRFDVQGWFPAEIESRGVEDKEILSLHYSRDDSLLLHKCIVDYAAEVLNGVYDTPEKLLNDYEVQEFASILVDKKDGAGIQGVFGGGKFEKLEDLIKVVAGTIFTASVSHAATNFCQYDEYAFPPVYPAKLYGEIPKNKIPHTEKDIISQLPDKEVTLSTMVITHLLSQRSTESLGYFDIQYLYEPKAVEAVKRFQDNLAEVGAKIDERNKHAKDPYPYLHPKEIPNAISI